MFAASSSAATDPVYCRLTVLAPRVRVHLALPADLPVAELIPMVLDLVGEPVYGMRPQPWRLTTVAGRELPTGRTLRAAGVLDGEQLRIAPAGTAPPAPVFDDPVHALAATAVVAGPDPHRLPSVAALVLATAAALLLAGAPTPDATGALLGNLLATSHSPAGPATVLVTTLAAASALAGAAWLARRTSPAVGGTPGGGSGGRGTPETEPHPTDIDDDPGAHQPASVHNRPAAIAAALAAVPLAVTAGWTVIPDAAPAARVLLAAMAAGCAAVVAQLAVRTPAPAMIGVLAAVAPVGLAALAVLQLAVPPATAAIATGALVLVAGALLPRAALWLSGLPRPLVVTDATELVAADHGTDLLPPDELAARARLARGYLTGLVGGCAVVAALGAVAAAAAPGWAGPLSAAVTVTLLGLRARSFVDPLPARIMAGSAVAAGVGLAVLLSWSSPEPWGRPAAAVGLLLAAAAVLAASRGTRTAPSPIRRRAVDLSEGLLTATVLPLALAAMDVYTLVRGW